MTKILNWRGEWTLGIDTLDDEHREMVDLLLNVAHRFGTEPPSAGASGKGRDNSKEACEDLYSALDRFGTFVRQHFHREEEFLRTIDYPGLADHHSEHLMLMAELTDLVRELRQRKVTHLGPQDLEALKQWVVAHILGADRKFADHYFQICR
jgi:hemerythrin